MILKHEFVEYIPEKIPEGTLYISIPYRTAIHKCCCGCKNEVVTPLSPTDWQLRFDGDSVSLEPSIGNWSFPCKSHYWITNNKVEWSTKWTASQIEAGRKRDKREKKKYQQKKSADSRQTPP